MLQLQILFLLFTTSIITAPKVPPPGTTKIGTNQFLDKKIITYLDYAECISWLKKKEPLTYPKMLTELISNTDFLKVNPELSDLPVTGLSKDQILIYCSWRSQMVNRLKSDSENHSCSPKLKNKWMKQDPHNQWEIIYELPKAQDLQKIKSAKTANSIPEWTADNESLHTNGNLTPNELAFRCVARYQKK